MQCGIVWYLHFYDNHLTNFLDFIFYCPAILVNNLKSASKCVTDTLWWAVISSIITFSNETIGGYLRYSQSMSQILKFGPLEDITCKLWIGFYNTQWVPLFEYCLKPCMQVFSCYQIFKNIYIILFCYSGTHTLRGLKYPLMNLMEKNHSNVKGNVSSHLPQVTGLIGLVT